VLKEGKDGEEENLTENNDYKQQQKTQEKIEYIHMQIHCIFPATVQSMPHS
jgi:hypothetical protein